MQKKRTESKNRFPLQVMGYGLRFRRFLAPQGVTRNLFRAMVFRGMFSRPPGRNPIGYIIFLFLIYIYKVRIRAHAQAHGLHRKVTGYGLRFL